MYAFCIMPLEQEDFELAFSLLKQIKLVSRYILLYGESVNLRINLLAITDQYNSANGNYV